MKTQPCPTSNYSASGIEKPTIFQQQTSKQLIHSRTRCRVSQIKIPNGLIDGGFNLTPLKDLNSFLVLQISDLYNFVLLFQFLCVELTAVEGRARVAVLSPMAMVEIGNDSDF
jgi:hypothetical protein